MLQHVTANTTHTLHTLVGWTKWQCYTLQDFCSLQIISCTFSPMPAGMWALHACPWKAQGIDYVRKWKGLNQPWVVERRKCTRGPTTQLKLNCITFVNKLETGRNMFILRKGHITCHNVIYFIVISMSQRFIKVLLIYNIYIYIYVFIKVYIYILLDYHYTICNFIVVLKDHLHYTFQKRVITVAYLDQPSYFDTVTVVNVIIVSYTSCFPFFCIFHLKTYCLDITNKRQLWFETDRQVAKYNLQSRILLISQSVCPLSQLPRQCPRMFRNISEEKHRWCDMANRRQISLCKLCLFE